MPELFVAGIPAPQGSKTRGRFGGVFESSKRVGPWRDVVQLAAADKCERPTEAPIALELAFVFGRPASHFKRDGSLRATARPRPTVTPDLDKLVRAIFDALQGIVYRYDAQVVELRASKDYGERPGVRIVWEAAA